MLQKYQCTVDTIDTIDITKFRKPQFFLQSFAVDAFDTVDNKQILFLIYPSKMFKDFLLLTKKSVFEICLKNVQTSYCC